MLRWGKESACGCQESYRVLGWHFGKEIQTILDFVVADACVRLRLCEEEREETLMSGPSLLVRRRRKGVA